MVIAASRRFLASAVGPLSGLTLVIAFIYAASAGPAPVGSLGVNVLAEVRRFSGHQDGVWSVAFAPDGKRALSASYDRTVRLWDVGSGKELLKLDGFPAAVMGVAFLPDGQACVSCCSDGSVLVRSLKDGKETLRFQAHNASANSLDLSADGKTLVTGGADGLVKIWECATGKEKRTLTGSGEWIWSVALSPNGKQVLAGGADKLARLWDVETGKELIQLTGHQDAVCCVAISPDGKQALTGSNDCEMRQWALDGGQLLRRMTDHKAPVYSVIFSHEGRHGFSAGADGVVRLWELVAPDRQNGGLAITGRARRGIALDQFGNPVAVETGKEMRRYEGHESAIYRIALSRDGRSMLSGGRDTTVRLWETRGIDSDLHDLLHPAPVSVAVFSSDSSKVFTFSTDGAFRSWDVEKGTMLKQSPMNAQVLRSQVMMNQGLMAQGVVIYSEVSMGPEGTGLHQAGLLPSGNRIAALYPTGQLATWNSDTNVLPRSPELKQSPGAQFLSVAFAKDGKEVVTGNSEGKIVAWDIQTGKELRSFQMPGKVIGALAIAPNGKDLLAASWHADEKGKASDVVISRLDRTTLKLVRTFEGHKDLVTGLAFSPNGQSFLSSSRDGTVRWWGLETKGKTQVVAIPGGAVTAITFIDNERFVSAGSDNAIRLWVLLGGTELQRLDGHQGTINSLAFSPSKNLLVSASADRSARVWKLGPDSGPGPSRPSKMTTKELILKK